MHMQDTFNLCVLTYRGKLARGSPMAGIISVYRITYNVMFSGTQAWENVMINLLCKWTLTEASIPIEGTFS